MDKTAPLPSPALEAYLRQLDAHLASLAPSERNDVLMETRSHVMERVARFPFPSIDDVLEQLGAPSVYAQQFAREAAPTTAVAPHAKKGTALRGLARLATAGWLGAPVLLLVVFSYVIALAAFAVALAKVLTPDDVGVWVKEVNGQQRFSHAGFNASLGGTEILGYRLAAIAASIGFVFAVVPTVFLRWLARGDKHDAG